MPTVAINDIEMYYESVGSGPPVILIHGWGTSGRVWDPQRLELAPTHEVITVDWRGCGLTTAGDTGNTIVQIADDLRAFIAETGLEQPVLVGASMGGTFALEVGLRWPDAVKGVITADAPYHRVAVDAAGMQELVDSLRSSRIPALYEMIQGWYPEGSRPGLFEWALHQVFQSSPFIDNLYLDHMGYDPRVSLSDTTVPVRLLHGALDQVIALEYPREAADLLGGDDVYVFEDCGHFPHQEDPLHFNQALRAALQSLDREVDGRAHEDLRAAGA